MVVGCVEAVELLECLPAGFEPRVGVKERVEAGLVSVGEGVSSTRQQEPGSEHLGLEDGFGAVGSALDVAAHRGQPGVEPSDDVEPVKHMAGVGQTGGDRGLAGGGSVGDDDFDPSTPLMGL